MTTQETVKKLNEYLRNNNFSYGVYSDFAFVKMEIHWGDWKHEHARVEYLVDQFCKENGITSMHACDVTEADGSDTYSAIHTWVFFS